MTRRRLPRPSAFSDLLKLKRPELNPTKRRLATAQTIYDLRDIAKRVTPRAPFDYTDGAAEAELSLSRARQAFEDIEFHPAILRDVSSVDTVGEVLGGPTSLPFGIAPTGFTRLMHTAGEVAGASAAGAAGIPFSLSTVGTTSPEGVQAANPDGRNWFQLYMWKDRERSIDVVDRAAMAGFDALLITVDVPVAGARLRDRYNGLTIPPAITLRTILNAIPTAALVVRLPHHRTRGVRHLRQVGRHGGRTAGRDVRSDGQFRRSGLDQGQMARQGRREGDPDPGRCQTRRRPRGRRGGAVEPRRTATRPCPGAVPPAAHGRPRDR